MVNMVWTVNLSRSVEPRMTGEGKTVAWMAVAFFAAIGLGLGLFGVQP